MKTPEQSILENLILLAGEVTPIGDLWNKGEKDEKPVLETNIKPFYLAKYLVTNIEFIEFLNTVVIGKDILDNDLIDYEQPLYEHTIYYKNGRFSCHENYNLYPVTFVSWIGAREYCNWLSLKTGLPVRLPNEAEWQYAAMSGKKLRWSHGNEFNPSLYVSGKESPDRVDSGTGTENGFYHLTGNVFEWCEDEYHFSNEKKQEDRLENMRVIKGGAFNFSFSENFTNSKKFSAYQASCLDNISFRIAMSN